MRSHRYKELLILFFSLLFLTYSGIVGRDFSTRGEGREALVAQAILETDEWILPRGFNDDIPSKPLMLHWMIAGISIITGEMNEFTARLPSALLSISAIIYFFLFLAKRYPSPLPLYTGLILASTIEWDRAATNARVDMALSAFLLLGFLNLYAWYERGFSGLPVAAILLFAAATLCKGPVALLLPFIAFILFLFWIREQFAPYLPKIFLVFSLATIISVGWYLAAYFRGGADFLDLVYYENLARFLGTLPDKPHEHSLLYLIGTTFLGLLPWSLLFLCGVFTIRKFFFAAALDPFSRFAFSIALCFLIFFSIPASKRSVYLLPAYPFFSYLISLSLLKLEAVQPKVLRYFSKGFAGLVLLIPVVFILLFELNAELYAQLPRKKTAFFVYQIESVLKNLSAGDFLIGSSLFGAAVVLIFKKGEYLQSLAFFTVLSLAAAEHIFIKQISNQMSSKNFAAELAEKTRDDSVLYTYLDEFYALSFYSGRKFYHLRPDNLQEDSLVLLFDTNLNRLEDAYPHTEFEIALSSSKYIEKPFKKVIVVKIKDVERGASREP